MILFDGVHLTSDVSVEELNNFALSHKIGLKMQWLQSKKIYHYDVIGCKVLVVQKLLQPINFVSSKELVKRAIRRK